MVHTAFEEEDVNGLPVKSVGVFRGYVIGGAGPWTPHT